MTALWAWWSNQRAGDEQISMGMVLAELLAHTDGCSSLLGTIGRCFEGVALDALTRPTL